MEKNYWIGRQRSAMAMARKASTAETRLIHYELAGRCSIKAATSAPVIFTLMTPATEGGRVTLHLREPTADFRTLGDRGDSVACELPGEKL